MKQPLLELKDVSKTYPGVQALKKVDFDLYAGELHFLLGENGAGKSTLMKILSGSVQKDSGTISLDGREITMNSPRDADRHGIAMVYQELSLFPALSVAENIMAGRLPRRKVTGMVNWGRAHADSRKILDGLGLDIPTTTPVQDLGVGASQLIEIGKALSRKVRVLLLDEPTSALSVHEVERLFQIIGDLLKRGIAIIYVSHKLAEVPRLAHRVTVLRDGEKVGTLDVKDAAEPTLIRMMVGREVTDRYPKETVPLGNPVLEVEGLCLGRRVRDVSFAVREGEIVGVFGLRGSGRTSLARSLFGLEPRDGGIIRIRGRVADIRSPGDAIRAGLGYITEERKLGLVMRMGVAPNMTFAALGSLLRFGLIDHAREREAAVGLIQRLRIVTPHVYQLVEFLSGGSQQKVALARWLCAKAHVLIMDEPTRGIDVGAKVEVYKFLSQQAREGAGVLFFSSELPEVMGISDRVLVMAQGELVATFDGGKSASDDIMAYAAGGCGSSPGGVLS
ncbi:MAG TPA: sugar ABC transporter ATP-binding protein [Bacillota bacterium]|nr:sugar ABC transporter ATP-binding protein [Bacillota bacterium]